jgi:TPR repeat protein
MIWLALILTLIARVALAADATPPPTNPSPAKQDAIKANALDDIPTMVITPNSDGRIARYEANGRDYLQKFRDISGARLWLEYAANHKSVRAARMLSDSYNPVWLIEQHVIGWEGLANPEQAFVWAKIAYELGDRAPDNLYAQAQKK